MSEFNASWNRAWANIGAANPDKDLMRRLLQCYAESHRKYHTQQHLFECLNHLELLKSEAQYLGEIEIAIWFHDAIYNPLAHDNEERSALWARTSIKDSEVDAEVAARVSQLILTTRHDGNAATTDQQIMLDVDLSILGADARRFDEYEQQVWKEYALVPRFIYQRKRSAVLLAFLERKRLFYTPLFFDLYEVKARENLARSIKMLT